MNATTFGGVDRGALERAPMRPMARSTLENVRNLTPFSLFRCRKMGPGHRLFDVVLLKGTFDLAPGTLRLAEVPSPVVVADEVWTPGRASRSSLRRAGEVVLAKTGADLTLSGSARSYGNEPRASWLCAVALKDGGRRLAGDVLEVTGPRRFRSAALASRVGDPEPTLQVPLRYELAYGGADDDRDPPRVFRPNPSGVGFVETRERIAPQWQRPDAPVTTLGDDVPVAGFGPIARAWKSRQRHAGTYDATWKTRVARDVLAGLPPDYPEDFDPRFFQVAPEALQTDAPLRGDETVGLSGFFPDRESLVFQLPGVRCIAQVLDPGLRWSEEPMRLDTVHVDFERAVVSTVFRLTLPLARGARAANLTFRRMS